MAQERGEWLTSIAERAKVDLGVVESVLVTHRIKAAPSRASPRRLMLMEVAFSGVKDGVSGSGPFVFCWKDLKDGLWAMLSDQNLRGKSSIIEVVRWLLRGRPSETLQEDVRRWIHAARLRFKLDDAVHEIQIEAKNKIAGTFSRLKTRDRAPVVIASFDSASEFETVMAEFFMRELAMESILSWREGKDDNDAGQAVPHGWVSFSGAMFVGTNYSVLLGDMPVAAGLNARLIQMYLGLPWVPTLAAAKAAEQALTKAKEAGERRRTQGSDGRRARVTQINAELSAARMELRDLPSDQSLQDRLSELSIAFAAAKKEEQAAHEAVENETVAKKNADRAYQEDRRDLQTHLDSVAAEAVFRMLDPAFCPRCDHEIDETRKKAEKATHACSICGEIITNDADAAILQSEIENRLGASKAALEQASASQKAAVGSLKELQARVANLRGESEQCMALLGNFARRQELVTLIAGLEGRLEEASYVPEPQGTSHDLELRVLRAIITETETRVKGLQNSLLAEVSKRLVAYARHFGMHNLSDATLKGNGSLFLTKGGAATSYSKVTDGEKLRLKVATVLAMVQAGEEHGVGRHPGLLMIDSPGAQEVSPEDLDQLVSGLREIAQGDVHFQVFVAGRSSKAITEHVPTANRVEAVGAGFLW